MNNAILTFLVLGCFGFVSGVAHAELQTTSLRVMVVLDEDIAKPDPLKAKVKQTPKVQKAEAQASEIRRLKRKRLAEVAARRIKRRLHAANIKSAQIQPQQHGEIAISIVGKHDKTWLESIVLPSGRFGVHAEVDAGQWWQDLMDDLPKGIAFRQPRGQDVSKAYLWSSNASTLRTYLKR